MDKILAVDSFARPLRAVAVLIAITTLAWEFVERLAGNPVADTEILTRAITAGVALVIAWFSSRHRSAETLRLLAFGLGLAIAAGEWTILAISPRESWVSITVLTAVIGGSALFIPWAWRWQALFAGTIELGVVITLLLVAPSRGLAYHEVAYAATILTAVAVASVIGAAHTDRERRRVVQSEAVYRSLFQSAGDAIAVLDADGVVRQVNRRFEHLLGVSLGEAIGRRLRDFYPAAPAPDPGGGTREHAAALSGEVGHASHVLVRADGTLLDVDITFARSEGPPPSGPVVQAILRDLTDMRAHERRQIQEERLDSLARFAGGIAHQFNNILGGILTHASLLRGDAANEASARELDEILTEARRGRELTKELLRFTRHEVVVLQPTALATVLESVTALARTTLPQTVAIDAGVPDGLPAVLGDADHLIHAGLQVVLNARDALAGRPNGRLTVHAGVETVSTDDPRWPEAAPGRYVRLSIGNNGPGMDAATLERVFEPFFTTKPMYQAAGIGLATVRAVMRDHHGVAKVESTPPPGLGTVVHLLIPVAPSGTAAPLTIVAPAAAPERTATILIVDDEAIVRSSLRRALTRFGYKVLEAGDGGTALAELQAAHPPVDLVILDLVLPGGGAGVFEILKSLRPDLRVLVSSGYSPDADNAKALAAKAQGFLAKPYEIKELREAVAHALAVPL